MASEPRNLAEVRTATYSTKQVARLLGINEKALRLWLAEDGGDFPFTLLPVSKAHFRFPRAEVDAYVQGDPDRVVAMREQIQARVAAARRPA